jgi:hypothetical protein
MRFRDPQTRRHGTPRSRACLAAILLLLSISLAGCADVLQSPPTPNPEPFPGITSQLGRFGVDVLTWTAGDPGCDDPSLSPTAIRFEAQGLDQPTPVQLRIYIFRNREAFDRRKADVETCVAAWAEDLPTFEILNESPYVLAGQGPWPPGFEDGIRKGLKESAGNGG